MNRKVIIDLPSSLPPNLKSKFNNSLLPDHLQNFRGRTQPPNLRDNIHLPLRARFLPNNLPQLLPGLFIMAIPQHSHSLIIDLGRTNGPNMSSDNEGSRARPEQTHNALRNNHLMVPVEEMEERHGVDDVQLAREAVDEARLVVEDVGDNEFGFQGIAVEEEIVADIC